MKDRTIAHDSVVKFFNLGFAASAPRWKRDFSFLIFPVNEEPVRSLANVAAFTAN